MKAARLVAMLTCVARFASAQDLSGTVSDSATRRPIPGAVVMLLDAAGATVGRNITNERGQYRVAAPLTARRMRVLRMGFRPRELAFPFTAQTFDVALVSIPTMLEQVRVVAGARCPRRSDRRAALALLEQARAGLLTAVVAREANPARMTILSFDRTMDRTGDQIESQNVRIKADEKVTTSFTAVRDAGEFVRRGFTADSGEVRHYFGPDADVLLDEGFSAGYCFHLRGGDRDRARPNQVGLAFLPANRRRDRVDIDGTLWIDTVARKLQDLEYRFLGLPAATNPVRPGGHSSFWEMANGVVFIDRWHLRLPAPVPDTTYSRNNDLQIREYFAIHESGGEVATAAWPDGQTYQAPLGTLNARAVDREGKAVSGFTVQLLGTDYVATPDSLGVFEMTNLLPGPYVAYVIHPELADINMILPTALRFVAVRDSAIHVDMQVPAINDHVREFAPFGTSAIVAPAAKFCANPAAYVRDPLLSVIVETPDGTPVNGAHWQLSKSVGAPWQRVIESRTTGADGRVLHCMKLKQGDEVEVKVWRDGEFPRTGIAHASRGRTFTMTLPYRQHMMRDQP